MSRHAVVLHATAAVATLAAMGLCTDLESNCVVMPLQNYSHQFDIEHRTPKRCPLHFVARPSHSEEFFAVVNTADEDVADYINTSVLNANGGQVGYLRTHGFSVTSSDWTRRSAQINGTYAAGTAGCTFGRKAQEDRAEAIAPSRAVYAQVYGGIVRLTYDYVDCSGTTGLSGSMMPYEPVTVTASPPNDPNWAGPTSYQWWLNGQIMSGVTGPTASATGGPGDQLYFEVVMRDATGLEVQNRIGGSIRNYGSCDPTVQTCNDQ